MNSQLFHNEKIESNSAKCRANALRAIRHRRKNNTSLQRQHISSSTFTISRNKSDLMNENNNQANNVRTIC